MSGEGRAKVVVARMAAVRAEVRIVYISVIWKGSLSRYMFDSRKKG